MDLKFFLFILVLVLSSIIHFAVQRFFIHKKKFDDFNHRSSHNTLATRTGGIGVFTTLLIVSSYYYFNKIELFDYSLFIPLGIMFVIGVYDDFYNADFKLKFFLQIIVAKILIDQGYVISNYHGLFGFYEIPWVIAQLSTIFIFLIIVNAINFIDGIDGLAISEVIKTILIIEFFSESPTILKPLGIIVIISIIPLYYFNFRKKQKIFLGDGGSMFLGSLIAVYIIYTLGNNFSFKPNIEINKTLFSILILLFPLVDLLRIFIIRIRDGKSPFEADNNHIHHRLLKRGVSHFGIVLLIFSINFIFLFLII